MMKNVNSYDAVIRGILGAILLMAAVVFMLWYLAVAGVILIATAVFNFCPIYAMFRMNTIGKNTPQATH